VLLGLVSSLLDEPRQGREIFIARRLKTSDRPTLQVLGDERGVTRERIRQVEEAATKAILEALKRPECAVLKQRAAALAAEIRIAVPLDSAVLRDALAQATDGIEDGPDFAAADFMLWLAGPYRKSGSRYLEPDGWMVRHDLSLDEIIYSFNKDLQGERVAGPERFVDALERVGLRSECLDAALGLSRTWRRIDQDTWVAWKGSATNKAEAVLELVGRPLTVNEINDRIGEGHSSHGLGDRLTNDKRFTRVDKKRRFALASWGFREYTGIANVMIREIERAGGSIEFSALADGMVKDFGVSRSSVTTYANTAAFVREKDRIRLRTDSEPVERDDRVFRCRGLFVRPNGQVVIHEVVDPDILRGSGRALAEPAATALGMRPGDRISLAFGDSEALKITWPLTSATGPALGSTRRIAAALGLSAGDDLRLILDAKHGTCEAQRPDWSTIEGASGIHVKPGRELAMIAEAIGVIPALARAHLKARGDLRLLDLLP